MNEALELAKKLAQAVPYIGRMDDGCSYGIKFREVPS